MFKGLMLRNVTKTNLKRAIMALISNPLHVTFSYFPRGIKISLQKCQAQKLF